MGTAISLAVGFDEDILYDSLLFGVEDLGEGVVQLGLILLHFFADG